VPNVSTRRAQTKEGAIRRIAAAAGVALVAFAALLIVPLAPALAHVARTVGAYHFLVGWGEEPVYAGTRNSVQLILTTSAGRPVNDLGDSLRVEVVYGTQKETLPLELNFDPDSGEGTAGDYRAWLIPTAPGDYTFRFTGTVHGQSVDQSFSSSPTTFDAVQDPSTVEFPVKVPPVQQVASLTQRLASRIAAAQAAERSAKRGANSATTIALVGVIVGALGLVAAIGAWAVAGRRRPMPARPEPASAAPRS
jgi:hypothetical protein